MLKASYNCFKCLLPISQTKNKIIHCQKEWHTKKKYSTYQKKVTYQKKIFHIPKKSDIPKKKFHIPKKSHKPKKNIPHTKKKWDPLFKVKNKLKYALLWLMIMPERFSQFLKCMWVEKKKSINMNQIDPWLWFIKSIGIKQDINYLKVGIILGTILHWRVWRIRNGRRLIDSNVVIDISCSDYSNRPTLIFLP
jgi:hypothetical protein